MRLSMRQVPFWLFHPSRVPMISSYAVGQLVGLLLGAAKDERALVRGEPEAEQRSVLPPPASPP
jgi:hypothetical protein